MPKYPTPVQSNTSRSNGGSSHGPKTTEGKNRSRFNARKHGLTAEHITLPGESVPAFERVLQAYLKRYQPADETEVILIQDLAETEWQIRRAKTLFRQCMVDRIQLQEPEVDEKWNDPNMILRCAIAYGYELSEGDGKNLALYESRLRRQRSNIMRDLQRLRDDFPLPLAPVDEVLREAENEFGKNEPENTITTVDSEQYKAPAAALQPIDIWEFETDDDAGLLVAPERPEIAPEHHPPEVKIMSVAA
jgi:hypothetical protein